MNTKSQRNRMRLNIEKQIQEDPESTVPAKLMYALLIQTDILVDKIEGYRAINGFTFGAFLLLGFAIGRC